MQGIPEFPSSSIHILDDESETSTFKYSPPKENQQKNIPLNMMAMFFFPTTNPKNNQQIRIPYFLGFRGHPPREKTDPCFHRGRFRRQAPVFPAAFQPSC